MSGSLKWMQYLDDAGTPYLVNIDESNGEAAGFTDVTNLNVNTPLLPKGFQMRYINVVRAGASGEDIRRKIYVGSVAKLTELQGTRVIQLADGDYNIRSFRGEKKRYAIAIDTAQNDGDIE